MLVKRETAPKCHKIVVVWFLLTGVFLPPLDTHVNQNRRRFCLTTVKPSRIYSLNSCSDPCHHKTTPPHLVSLFPHGCATQTLPLSKPLSLQARSGLLLLLECFEILTEAKCDVRGLGLRDFVSDFVSLSVRDLDLFFVLGVFGSGGLQNLFSIAMFSEN